MQDLVGWAVRHKTILAEQHQAVGLGGQSQVVGGQDDQVSGVGQGAGNSDQPGLVGIILPERWLVQQYSVVRLAHQDRGQRQAFLFTLAQEQGRGLLVARQSQGLQQPGVAGHVRIGQVKEDLVADGGVERAADRRSGRPGPSSGRARSCPCAWSPSMTMSSFVFLQACQRAKECRLACAISANDGNHLSGLERKAQLAKDLAAAQRDGQPFDHQRAKAPWRSVSIKVRHGDLGRAGPIQIEGLQARDRAQVLLPVLADGQGCACLGQFEQVVDQLGCCRAIQHRERLVEHQQPRFAGGDGRQGQLLLLAPGERLGRAVAHGLQSKASQGLVRALADRSGVQAKILQPKDDSLFHRLGQHLRRGILENETRALGQLPQRGIGCAQDIQPHLSL